MAKPPPDPDRVARVLADADQLGVEAAAQRHGIHVRTVHTYRTMRKNDPVVAEKTTEAKKELQEAWLERAKRARQSILGKLEDLCALANPEQIREVAGALKIVSDAILAEQVVRPEEQDGRRAHNGAKLESESGPVKAAQGAIERLETALQ